MEKNTLIIIDIQNDYFEQGNNPLIGSLQASENAKKLLAKFRQENQPVIHIQHISTRPDATFFLPDTPGAEIHQNVAPIKGETIIQKHTPNSFVGTNLHKYLQKQKITHLTICGMMTHMCVDTTLRAAKDLGYNCTLIGDACATCDLTYKQQTTKAQDVQNAFLASLSYYFATITDTRTYLK